MRTRITSGGPGRRLTRGEPQLRQKIRCTPGEDSKSPSCGVPETILKLAASTCAAARNAVPFALRQREQWHRLTGPISPAIS
jgi:hypothetical protein